MSVVQCNDRGSPKEISLLSISVKQYVYKLKAYSGMVNKLIITQMLALLFSIAGANSMMTSNNGEITVSVRYYSASMVIVFSLFWIITVAFLLTTSQYKKIDIPLVANRISGSLSDVGFLMTACVFAGMTSSLVGVLSRVIMFFTYDRSMIVYNGFFFTYSDLLLGMVTAILYMILVASLCYFLGMIGQVSMAFIVIIPALFLGLLRMYSDFFSSVVRFYSGEASLSLFALKVCITAIFLFGASGLLSNRMEVGK